ncbi:Hypothetical predicted protein [Mytilus galloprovincialis]|uniref:C-type lectin domain-containing protein n=1 Tax=Mytilus galloprovincialis TaxID=29158 RepID=A0A8B6GIK7_MYTGA|nr:Hypothetical predicted protein [Mytilus galloprovincialis]
MTSPQEQTSTIAVTTFYETLSTINATISTGSEKKENRTNAEISTGYFSDRNHTWKEAKGHCKIIGLLDKIQVQDSEERLGWVDASAEYSPWVEYTMNVSRQVHIGNCLSVTSFKGQLVFQASPCGTKFKPLCSEQNTRPIYNNVLANDWVNSSSLCSSYGLASYDMIKQLKHLREGNFWLGTIRRPIIHRSAEADPEYCIAVIIPPDDYQVLRYIKPCTEKLPALCDCVTDMPSSNKNTCNTPPETGEHTIKSIVQIAIISTAVVAVALIIAVIVLYVRSARHPTLASCNEVIYENTPNNTTINQTTDNTCDQMHYQSLSQNRIPIESNYTPLQSAGVDVTRTTDKHGHNVIDESVEHFLVEEDYQEIEDVST